MMYLMTGLFALLLGTSGLAYWQYKQGIELQKQITKDAVELSIQQGTITAISNNLVQTTKRIEFVQQQNEIISSNAQAQIRVFEKHNLEIGRAHV